MDKSSSSGDNIHASHHDGFDTRDQPPAYDPATTSLSQVKIRSKAPTPPPVVLTWAPDALQASTSTEHAPQLAWDRPSQQTWKQPAQQMWTQPSQQYRPLQHSSDDSVQVPEIRNSALPPETYGTVVHFEPVPMAVDKCKQALHAVFASTKTLPSLNNIIGSYMSTKRGNELQRISRGVFGEYSRSRPEIQMYNHLMHKLESLSHDVVTHKGCPVDWNAAIGPYRREVFNELYENNDLVRCFAREMEGGSMKLPLLDQWTLGLKRTVWSHPRAAVRSPNINASLELLGRVRTVVLVDDSGSMNDSGHTAWGGARGNDWRYNCDNETRWTQTRDVLAGVVPKVAAQSPHGVDLHFLNRTEYYQNIRTEAEVQAIFTGHPNGGTHTGQRINDILDGYMSTLRYDRSLMPLNLIVITDGEAEDEELLHWAIEEHVTKIMQRGYQAHQIGIEFVQTGDCQYATEHLERLEEEVSRHHKAFQRDVVGVTPMSRVSAMNPDVLLAITVSGIDARINGYMRKRRVNI